MKRKLSALAATVMVGALAACGTPAPSAPVCPPGTVWEWDDRECDDADSRHVSTYKRPKTVPVSRYGVRPAPAPKPAYRAPARTTTKR